jgi:RNA polymerase sigma-70 factor (ECF subfamily)
MTDGETLSGLPEASSRAGLGDVFALYQEHAAFLRRFLTHLGVHEPDVDDLLQDVFVAALQGQSKFEGRSTVRTWLAGVAVRVAAGHRRKMRLRQLFGLAPSESVERRAFVDDRTPARPLEQAEARREVQRILDQLSGPKRAVLLLYEIEHMSGEDIATALGCPVKTVWTRLFYARRDFVTALRTRGLIESRESTKKGVD